MKFVGLALIGQAVAWAPASSGAKRNVGLHASKQVPHGGKRAPGVSMIDTFASETHLIMISL